MTYVNENPFIFVQVALATLVLSCITFALPPVGILLSVWLVTHVVRKRRRVLAERQVRLEKRKANWGF